MNNTPRSYEPHLALQEYSVPPGGEWVPPSGNWSLIQIAEEMAYYLQPGSQRELDAGSILLVPGSGEISLRASHLSRMSFHFFSVLPRCLGGLLTLGEQNFFRAPEFAGRAPFRTFQANHPLAATMKELCACSNQHGLAFRLKLLQVFVAAFDQELDRPTTGVPGAVDARERLRVVLGKTPAAELLEMSSNELAQRTHCTARHFNRVFRELVGLSFQDKRAELRLDRARELLATSDSKIVDVALESGYKSLSLFHLTFTRCYGTSPGKWRQKNSSQRSKNGKRAVRNAAVARSQ